jgi:hypothetical protein
MKNIWLWLVAGAALVAFMVFRGKASSTAANATAAASAGLTANPVNTLWGKVNQAAASVGGIQQAQKDVSNLLSTTGSIFGFGSQGGSSPQTAGSGSGGPTQAQVNQAASGGVATDLPDNSADFGGGSSNNYGG